MACDERLVARIRVALQGVEGTNERRMFGGACFTLNGHMFCGVVKDELMVRVGLEQYQSALQRLHTREMDFTGRAMCGYVFVSKPGIKNAASLRAWLERARKFVIKLPHKRASKRRNK
jgi:TfoX/Sxy family transcriptional regulator of competence genes